MSVVRDFLKGRKLGDLHIVAKHKKELFGGWPPVVWIKIRNKECVKQEMMFTIIVENEYEEVKA